MEARVTFLFDLQWNDSFPLAGPLPMVEVQPLSLSSSNNTTASVVASPDLYDESKCAFLMPNVILNESNGVLWTLDIKVEEMAAALSSRDAVVLLQFLVRRAKSKPLILDHLVRLISAQTPVCC